MESILKGEKFEEKDTLIPFSAFQNINYVNYRITCLCFAKFIGEDKH